ncbi:DUF72 domain-containing protein [Acidobacteriia bacterium AH_259_A11_L15]|nr:DUF72 domain-containing protein [Acidobacteriia bacterium AH_259_A11_L15]
MLFQLPPSFGADWTLLKKFLQLRPRAFRFALEFRHPSWHVEPTYALLRHYEAALCLAETEKEGLVDVYAYCKHEEAGRAPAYARRLLC